jgi:transposase InsO family protein
MSTGRTTETGRSAPRCRSLRRTTMREYRWPDARWNDWCARWGSKEPSGANGFERRSAYTKAYRPLDLVNREFTASAPNQLWVAVVTCVATWKGFVWVAFVRVGNSYDNALAESVIGLFKTEVIRIGGPWRSLESVEFATLEWVDWFNNRRLLEPIGNVPPVEFEMAYYQSQDSPAMMAGLT